MPTVNEHGLPIVLDPFTGEYRVLGTLPSDPHFVRSLPTFTEAGNEVIPESYWQEFDIWPEHINIKDQDGRGACNGHAAALSLELARFNAGYAHVPLSAWYVYAILCGGIDRGSSISDALKLLSSEGTCPESDLAYGTINPRVIGSQAKADAARYKISLGTAQTTWEEVMSAVQLRRPQNLSIHVGAGFNNLDSEGVPGVGRGPGNHAVCVAFGAKKSSKHGWLLKMANSWSTRWGQNGFCWLSQAHIEGGSYFESYEVVAATPDPNDSENPPDPVA